MRSKALAWSSKNDGGDLVKARAAEPGYVILKGRGRVAEELAPGGEKRLGCTTSVNLKVTERSRDVRAAVTTAYNNLARRKQWLKDGPNNVGESRADQAPKARGELEGPHVTGAHWGVLLRDPDEQVNGVTSNQAKLHVRCLR
jgi:hypothetical protein